MSLFKTTVNETLKWLSALPILLQNCCGGDCSIGIVTPPTTFWYLSCHQYLSMDNAVLNKYSELFRTGRFKYLKQLAFTKHVLFSPVGRRDLSTVKNLRLRVLFWKVLLTFYNIYKKINFLIEPYDLSQVMGALQVKPLNDKHQRGCDVQWMSY